ncbi:MAG: RDD family protein [Inhella sp.]
MSNAIDPRFAPPQAHVEDRAPEVVTMAGRGTRLVAAVVDGVIAAAVAWGVYMIPVMQPLLVAQERATEASIWGLTPLNLGLGLLVFLMVQGWSLVTRGQTLGKMLFKLRIVRSDGSRVDAWRLLGLRYGIGMLMNFSTGIAMIYSLIDSVLIFRASRKCLHDSIADTQVIKL